MRGQGLHLHLDPVGGAAGDMFIAAMLHAFPELAERALADVAAVLPAEVGHAELSEHVASGITARRFELVLAAPDAGRRHGAETTYRAMRELLENAPLSEGTAQAACAILHRIAEAEAQVHDIPIDRVHFHEIADWDALMDVTAAGSICAALSGATVSLAPLPLGGGLVETAHGKLPVPAPATALILQGYDWHDDGVPGERVTPTGAAILAHLTGGSPIACRPPGRLRCTGSGAGMRVMKGLPNILRVSVFDTASGGIAQDSLVQFACDIDDMTGEELGAAVDRLRAMDGVVDLLMFSGQGKKSRPVTRLELLVQPQEADAVAAQVFDLTSTLGLRRSLVDRFILARESDDSGPLRRKRATRPGGHETVKVESDDLADAETLHDRRKRARASEG
ncbi:LarC family nickel insertion protein [uncultured Sulfitobacter sp.]|uniref:LarC family nickel insertion protein n=1 Tax=uncultured Sulfitobacter sp. TaxID=191468 RepID=UPI000AC0012D